MQRSVLLSAEQNIPTRDHTQTDSQAPTKDQRLTDWGRAGHVTTSSIPPQQTPPFTAAVTSSRAASHHSLPQPGSNLSSADRQEIGFYRSLIDR